MVELTTDWMGLRLASPLVVAASPISRDPDAVAAAVDAGAGAVVMHSLFEEQLVHEQLAAHRYLDAHLDRDAESMGVARAAGQPRLDGEPYLEELTALTRRVSVPVLGSLNGTTPGGWVRYARRLEDAGAAAIELNLYDVATSPDESAAAIERRQLDVVARVVAEVRIPVTVKLSWFHASVPAFAKALEGAGARGVAVFNRFYQPDVNLDALDVDRHLHLSTSAELPIRLHALATLSPWTKLSLACTGGVHDGRDAAKALLSGAHVIQLASALLAHGPAHVGVVLRELSEWLDAGGYRSSAEARGVLDVSRAPDPRAWTRLNYAMLLDGWRGSGR